MNNFFEVWQKSLSGKPTDEEIIKAASDLYPVLFNDAMARGETWKIKPRPICCLNEFVPSLQNRQEGKTFQDYLDQALLEKSGLGWDPQKHVLVFVPLQILGARKFVVFEK